jgi:hypothetical protein
MIIAGDQGPTAASQASSDCTRQQTAGDVVPSGADFTFVAGTTGGTKGAGYPGGATSTSASMPLTDDPHMQRQMNELWQRLEGTLTDKADDVRRTMEDYGIGDGDKDSDTDEGQIWRMVQGDAPYTGSAVINAPYTLDLR